MSRASGRCCAFRPRSFSHLSVRRRSYCYFLAWWFTACARSFTENSSPNDKPPSSAGFLNSTSAVALQTTDAAHGNCRMRERQYDRYDKHRCHRSNQGYGPQHLACHEPLPRIWLEHPTLTNSFRGGDPRTHLIVTGSRGTNIEFPH